MPHFEHFELFGIVNNLCITELRTGPWRPLTIQNVQNVATELSDYEIWIPLAFSIAQSSMHNWLPSPICNHTTVTNRPCTISFHFGFQIKCQENRNPRSFMEGNTCWCLNSTRSNLQFSLRTQVVGEMWDDLLMLQIEVKCCQKSWEMSIFNNPLGQRSNPLSYEREPSTLFFHWLTKEKKLIEWIGTFQFSRSIRFVVILPVLICFICTILSILILLQVYT